MLVAAFSPTIALVWSHLPTAYSTGFCLACKQDQEWFRFWILKASEQPGASFFFSKHFSEIIQKAGQEWDETFLESDEWQATQMNKDPKAKRTTASWTNLLYWSLCTWSGGCIRRVPPIWSFFFFNTRKYRTKISRFWLLMLWRGKKWSFKTLIILKHLHYFPPPFLSP
jgi:hypothetical protein